MIKKILKKRNIPKVLNLLKLHNEYNPKRSFFNNRLNFFNKYWYEIRKLLSNNFLNNKNYFRIIKQKDRFKLFKGFIKNYFMKIINKINRK